MPGRCLAASFSAAPSCAVTALGLQAGRRLAPRSPRRLFALMTAAFGVGQMLGPIVAGLLAEMVRQFFRSVDRCRRRPRGFGGPCLVGPQAGVSSGESGSPLLYMTIM